MNTPTDFGDIVFIPIAFFVGPIVVIYGLFRGFRDRRKNSKKQNYLLFCITVVILASTVIGYLVLKAKENRYNYCDKKYSIGSDESYKCGIHEID